MATRAGNVVARGGQEAPETVELCVCNKDGFRASSARMPAAIVRGIGTPTVARLHGRRYAPDTEPAPPRSGKHEVPHKGRAS